MSMNKKKNGLKKILQASLPVFAKYGFKKSTMEDIANELGMTQGNLYFYIKNKKELYEKAVLYAISAWRKHRIEAMYRETDIVKQILVYAQAGIEYLEKHPDLRAILARDSDFLFKDMSSIDASILSERSTEELTMIESRFPQRLQEGIRQKRLREFNVDIVSTLMRQIYILFINQSLIKPEGITNQELTKEVVDLILYGLVNRDAEVNHA